MAYTEATSEYLEQVLQSETVYYYSDGPHVKSFRYLNLKDNQLLLKMMDDVVLIKNKTLSFPYAIDRLIDSVNNIVRLTEVPINYMGKVNSFSSEMDFNSRLKQLDPNEAFDFRYSPQLPPSKKFLVMPKQVYSPLSFSIATKIFSVADTMLSRKDLDLNGNHNYNCPHAIDFMENDSVQNGLVTKMINRQDFEVEPFEHEIMGLIENATDTNDVIALANILQVSSLITKDERFSTDVQKESSKVLSIVKTKINDVI